jgi:hypothetical protein
MAKQRASGLPNPDKRARKGGTGKYAAGVNTNSKGKIVGSGNS